MGDGNLTDKPVQLAQATPPPTDGQAWRAQWGRPAPIVPVPPGDKQNPFTPPVYTQPPSWASPPAGPRPTDTVPQPGVIVPPPQWDQTPQPRPGTSPQPSGPSWNDQALDRVRRDGNWMAAQGGSQNGVTPLTPEQERLLRDTARPKSSINGVVLTGALTGAGTEWLMATLDQSVKATPVADMGTAKKFWSTYSPNLATDRVLVDRIAELNRNRPHMVIIEDGFKKAYEDLEKPVLDLLKDRVAASASSTADDLIKAQVEFLRSRPTDLSKVEAVLADSASEIGTGGKLWLKGSAEADALVAYVSGQAKVQDDLAKATLAITEHDALVARLSNERQLLRVGKSEIMLGARRGIVWTGLALGGAYFADNYLTGRARTDYLGQLVTDAAVVPGLIWGAHKLDKSAAKMIAETPELAPQAAKLTGWRNKMLWVAGGTFLYGRFFNSNASVETSPMLRVTPVSAATIGIAAAGPWNGTIKIPRLGEVPTRAVVTGGAVAANFASNGLQWVQDQPAVRNSVIKPNSVALYGTAASIMLGRTKQERALGLLATAATTMGTNYFGGNADTWTGSALEINTPDLALVGGTAYAAHKMKLSPKNTARVLAGAFVVDRVANLGMHALGWDKGGAYNLMQDGIKAFERDEKEHNIGTFFSAVDSLKAMGMRRDGEAPLDGQISTWQQKEGKIPQDQFLRGLALLNLAAGEVRMAKGSRPVSYNETNAHIVYGDNARVLRDHKVDLFQESSLALLDAQRCVEELAVLYQQSGNTEGLEQCRAMAGKIEADLLVLYDREGKHDIDKVFDEMKQVWKTNAEMSKVLIQRQEEFVPFYNNPAVDIRYQGKASRDLALINLASASVNLDGNNAEHAVQKLLAVKQYLDMAHSVDPTHPNFQRVVNIYKRLLQSVPPALVNQYGSTLNNPFRVSR